MIRVLACVLALAQATSSPADKYQRNAALNAAFKDPATTDIAEARSLLNAALSDPDVLLRTSALGIIAGIRVRRLSPRPADAAPWARFLPLALELRPRVLEALNDPVDRVRGQAINTLTTIDVEVEGSAPPFVVRLPLALAQLLQRQFVADKSPAVRTAIVGFLRNAGLRQDPATLAITKDVLLKGLEDPNPDVVQFAAHAMYEKKFPEALPLLVKQLANPSRAARMGVSAGLQGYGAAARPYLPQLEDALAREPQGPTRRTLEAAIARIRDGRTP